MANTSDTVLVIGACGQLGSELTLELRNMYGGQNVVAADIAPPKQTDLLESGPFEKVDVLDTKVLADLASKYKFKHIYHLAAVLSATGEKNPKFAWRLNMDGLFNILDLALSIAIVAVTADMSTADTINMALKEPQRYSEVLSSVYPVIAAFGGVFLLMVIAVAASEVVPWT